MSTTPAVPLFTTQSVASALKTSIWTIQFKKVDGSIRHLRGTLHPELLPPVVESKESKEPKTKRTPAEGVVTVYDLDEKSWRSFKLENLIHMSLYIPSAPSPL